MSVYMTEDKEEATRITDEQKDRTNSFNQATEGYQTDKTEPKSKLSSAIVRQQVSLYNYFKPLAKKQWEAGTVEKQGHVQFVLEDIVENCQGVINNAPMASVALKRVEQLGKVKKLRRGTQAEHALWDVQELLNDEAVAKAAAGEVTPELITKMPRTTEHVEVKVVRNDSPSPFVEDEHKAEAAATVVVQEAKPAVTPQENNQAVLTRFNDTLAEMVSYLRKLPEEMIGHLQDIAQDFQPIQDGKQVQELEQKLHNLQFQNATLQSQLEQAKNNQHINKHLVYRHRNFIIDELERYIASPSWQQKNRADILRKTVTGKLDDILTEANITEDEESKIS